MTKFTVEGIEYQMVDKAEELLVSQFFQIEELIAQISELTNSQIIMSMIEVLSSQPKGSLNEIDVDTSSKLGEIVGLIDYKNIVATNKEYITIEGTDYVFKKNMDKLTMGEQISIELLQKRSLSVIDSNLNALAILLRPGKSAIDKETKKEIWIQDKFDTDNLPYRVELFRKHLKAVDALGVLRFFLSGNKESETPIPHSTLEKPQLRKKARLNQKSPKI